MPGPAVLAARWRGLRAARRGARFFGGRLFADRVVRRERDFGAMIPLTLAASTMPRPGLASHAEAGFSPCHWRSAKPPPAS
jgi:hypothetical protein